MKFEIGKTYISSLGIKYECVRRTENCVVLHDDLYDEECRKMIKTDGFYPGEMVLFRDSQFVDETLYAYHEVA